MTDQFYWIAYYDNGHLPTDQRNGATYANIDRENLTAFGLYHNGHPLIMLDFRPDSDDPDIGPKRLIWRKRTAKRSDGSAASIHLIGWQRKVNGRNVQAICYVNEEGTAILGGQWDKEYPFVHDTPPLECETDRL